MEEANNKFIIREIGTDAEYAEMLKGFEAIKKKIFNARLFQKHLRKIVMGIRHDIRENGVREKRVKTAEDLEMMKAYADKMLALDPNWKSEAELFYITKEGYVKKRVDEFS